MYGIEGHIEPEDRLRSSHLEPESVRTLGFAAAGGRSTRMGRDKALLPWAGTTLLGHALQALRAAFGDARILAGSERRYEEYGAPLVLDEPNNAGPLGGLCAALETARAEGFAGVFLLGIDMPLVGPELLREIALARSGFGVDIAAPHGPEGPEPLCAAYGTACLEPARRSAAQGRFKMTDFWAQVSCRLVEEDFLRPFGDPARLFANLNAPDDYDRMRPRPPR
jgi:molybdopterin-guanine dinucleotide biosynthesis protein A